MPVKSPVTHSTHTRLVERFDTAPIIRSYEEVGIDVGRFFAGLDEIELHECLDTGYRFFLPEMIFGDDQFYQDLYQKLANYYFVNRWEHQEVRKFILPGSSLLEVGCGDGYFLQSMAGTCPRIKGLELNSTAIRVAREKGLDVEATTIQDFAANANEQFDVVCCYQVLEHIFDIRSFLSAMRTCLKPGGLMIVAVPNNNPYIFRYYREYFLNLPPHHAGLWDRRSLENLAKPFDLQMPRILFEPLIEVKWWYQAHIRHYRKTNQLASLVMRLVPRQIYKPVLRMLKHKIQGKTVMAVFQAPNSNQS